MTGPARSRPGPRVRRTPARRTCGCGAPGREVPRGRPRGPGSEPQGGGRGGAARGDGNKVKVRLGRGKEWGPGQGRGRGSRRAEGAPGAGHLGGAFPGGDGGPPETPRARCLPGAFPRSTTRASSPGLAPSGRKVSGSGSVLRLPLDLRGSRLPPCPGGTRLCASRALGAGLLFMPRRARAGTVRAAARGRRARSAPTVRPSGAARAGADWPVRTAAGGPAGPAGPSCAAGTRSQRTRACCLFC